MRIAASYRIGSLLVALLMPHLIAAAEPCRPQRFGAYTLENIAPDVPAEALAAMLREVERRTDGDGTDFPASQMKRAVAQIAGYRQAPVDAGDLDNEKSGNLGEYNGAGAVPAYRPERPPNDAQREAYGAAAALYWTGDLTAAISAFDAIVKDSSSPYRAAAAYSAARATLRRREWAAGIDRIARITRDPELEEFNLAARHLLGTFSYRFNSPEAVAAKYVQEIQALSAYASADANDTVRAEQAAELADLDWFLNLYRSSAYAGAPTVLDRLAQADPRLDLLRGLAAPTPYQEQVYGGFRWSYPLARLSADGTLSWDESAPYADMAGGAALVPWSSKDGLRLTAHARAEWLRTQNLLWGLAFARRTDSAKDSTLLLAMLEKADMLPEGGELSCAKQPLVLHFLSQLVRLAITAEQTTEAQALIEKYRSYLVPPAVGIEQFSPRSRMAWRTSAVVEAPIVFYLRRGQFARARDWQVRMRTYAGATVGAQWRVLLATDYPKAFVPVANDPYQRLVALMPLDSAYDLLPISRMVSIARQSTTPEPVRRALIGAGWVRSIALNRADQRDALLPDLRASFPELGPDLDRAARARSPEERRFQFARILLANPGLGLYPSRLHDYARYLDLTASSHAAPRDLRVIDPGNPNDGNWWCPLSTERLRADLASGFFLGPTLTGIRDENRGYSQAVTPERLDLADRLVARHPLLTGIDRREIDALTEVDSGPALLSRAVFQWMDRPQIGARSAAESDEIAAALHDVVRSTRYGCRRSGSTAEISREAHRRLHSRFPDSEWTRRTPYWFDR